MSSILREYGLAQITIEQYKTVFEFPVISYYKKLGFDFSKTSFDEIGTQFIHTYESRRNECKLQKNVKKSLKIFADSDISQSVLSAAKHSYLEQALSDNGISNYFNTVNGLDNHNAFGKEEIAQHWIKNSEFDPAEIVLIGDTVHDSDVANSINVDSVLIAQGHQIKEKLLNTGAMVLDSVSELIQ